MSKVEEKKVELLNSVAAKEAFASMVARGVRMRAIYNAKMNRS